MNAVDERERELAEDRSRNLAAVIAKLRYCWQIGMAKGPRLSVKERTEYDRATRDLRRIQREFGTTEGGDDRLPMALLVKAILKI